MRLMHNSNWLLCILLHGCIVLASSANVFPTTNPMFTEELILTTANLNAVEVVIPKLASQQIQNAATLLTNYIIKSLGGVIPIVKQPSSNCMLHINVGATEYANKLIFPDLDADGFIIEFPNTNNIVIHGGSDYGTEFGVDEFIERYLGVRWLFPGELGECIPIRQSITITNITVRQEPVFLMRTLAGLPGLQIGECRVWSKRLRMRSWPDSRLWCEHNIGKTIIPPKKYVVSNPEFFPIHNGTRYLPSTNSAGVWSLSKWQPCYSNEKTITEAVKNICEYFTNNPSEQCCSLGVNDESGYCQCGACLNAVAGKTNFLGLANYSDQYYNWINKVVESVLTNFPNKYFGLLAYSEVIQPPSNFRLNSRVTPMITYERLKWIVTDIKNNDQELTKQWNFKSQSLGWYDYTYGQKYLIPREWFHLMADYYRFAKSNNVTYLYSEATPQTNYMEWPKLYISMKLQWNPNLDVETLLNEWYIDAVGAASATYIAQYFSLWEDYWTNRVKQTKWFKSCLVENAQYLRFYDTNYLSGLSTLDYNNCEALLGLCLANAGTEKQKARAQYFLDTYHSWSASLNK